VEEFPTAFFSYCRDDSKFALRLAGDLKAAGADVWLDQLDILPGQRWDRTVEDALTNCSRMLVILTPASVNSTNVMDEVSFALEAQKTVIPVLFRDCAIPFRLRRVQHIDFRADYAAGLQALIRTLSAERVPRTDPVTAAASSASNINAVASLPSANVGTANNTDRKAPAEPERRIPRAKVDYSDVIGHFVGESLNVTYNRKGKTSLRITKVDSSGRVSASFGWTEGLNAKGELLGSIDEDRRLELVGIVSSLSTGSLDLHLIAEFADGDTIRGDYTLKARSFLSTDQEGRLVLTREK
jgi:hypothetical protein